MSSVSGHRWIEGAVDQTSEHLVLMHERWGELPVALVGPPVDRVFPVTFLIKDRPSDGRQAEIARDVRRELDYYLVDQGGPDPWAYARYHTGTLANVHACVSWGLLPSGYSRPVGGQDFLGRLESLSVRAWELHRRVAVVPDGGCACPSVPILYFGALDEYLRSEVKAITVGLNPSHVEFPANEPWLRFPDAAQLSLEAMGHSDGVTTYLDALGRYFSEAPYRRWFDGSFEPLLEGLGCSYYGGELGTALHTDIASPVSTNPTWSRLGERRALHGGGPALWRDLVDVLAPDVIFISVARRHLGELTPRPVDQWDELVRVERERPFVVRATTVIAGGREALVVFGRAVNLPFGSVSFADRRMIGRAVSARLDTGWSS